MGRPKKADGEKAKRYNITMEPVTQKRESVLRREDRCSRAELFRRLVDAEYTKRFPNGDNPIPETTKVTPLISRTKPFNRK